jgi:hypothetical protein
VLALPVSLSKPRDAGPSSVICLLDELKTALENWINTWNSVPIHGSPGEGKGVELQT